MSKTHGQNGKHTTERLQSQKPKPNGGKSYYGTVTLNPDEQQEQVYQVMPEDTIKNPRPPLGKRTDMPAAPAPKGNQQQKRS